MTSQTEVGLGTAGHGGTVRYGGYLLTDESYADFLLNLRGAAGEG